MKELQNQDNSGTADPVFVVYDWEKVPTDPDYSNDYYYLWDGESEYDSLDELRDSMVDNGNNPPIEDFEEWAMNEGDVRKVYYLKRRVFVSVFLTRKAAETFIKANSYHWNEPHIYVHSLWRNNEMKEIRDHFLNLNTIKK